MTLMGASPFASSGGGNYGDRTLYHLEWSDNNYHLAGGAYVELHSVSLNRQKRIDILSETFGGRVHEYLHNFMCILVENGTFRQLPDCLEEYRRQYDLLHGIIRVTAVTAVPMDETQLAALREKLAAQTGRQVELSTRSDPSTMGGVVLEMEGKRIDGSVRARLEAIRSELLSVKA